MDRKMAGKRKPPRNESRPQARTAGKDRPPKAAQAGGGRERQGFSRRGEKEAFAPKRLAEGRMLLYGFHAIREALRAGRRQVFEVQATPAAAERMTGELAKEWNWAHDYIINEMLVKAGRDPMPKKTYNYFLKAIEDIRACADPVKRQNAINEWACRNETSLIGLQGLIK